jgi:hypothetical protein
MMGAPTTLITHCALAVLTGYFAWKLARAARGLPDVAPRLWAAAFVAVSLCAIAGGTHEGFAPQLDASVAQALSRATLCLAGAASLLFLSSIVHAFTAGRVRTALLALATAKFAVLAMWIAGHDDLRFVVYDTLATMIPVLALSAWGGWSRREAAPWVLAGILASLVAALVQQGRVTLHPQFDYSNLFRLIQMIAMYLLFRAGLEMRDQPSEALAPIGTRAQSES